jgi:RNA polymerase sigma-70 factor, ECF subfamily
MQGAGPCSRGGTRLSSATGQPLSRLSERELIQGSRTAPAQRAVFIEELFRRHYPKVVAWCLRFAGDHAEAQDLAQSTFVRAYRHLDAFRGDSSFVTWLYVITRSECMNAVTRRRKPTAIPEEELAQLPDDDTARPDEGLEQEGNAKILNSLLDLALDETEKKVFTLHYGEDVPLDAITRLLGLSNRTGAKTVIVRARRKLARALRVWKAREQELGT